MMHAFKKMMLILTLLAVAACSTTEKKDGGDVGGGGGGGAGGGGDSGGDGGGDGGGSAAVSANRVTLTNSWSNNQLTSQTINRGKAESQAESISGKDKRSLEGKASAMRLAGKGGSALMAIAKKIAEVEMEKTPNKEIDAALKLEIALAAMSSREFTLAFYFLEDITADKKAPPRVRAGAYNALGVIALKDDRVPEAVVYFKQALGIEGSYKPAKLNLAFTALKGGGMPMAKSYISDFQNDWFAQYGMISIERMEGDTGRAADLCEKVLSKESSHKAALFNCGLLEAQNKKNFKKALELVSRAAKGKGGEPGWDERIQQGERAIEQDQAAEKAKAPPANGAKDNKPNKPK